MYRRSASHSFWPSEKKEKATQLHLQELCVLKRNYQHAVSLILIMPIPLHSKVLLDDEGYVRRSSCDVRSFSIIDIAFAFCKKNCVCVRCPLRACPEPAVNHLVFESKIKRLPRHTRTCIPRMHIHEIVRGRRRLRFALEFHRVWDCDILMPRCSIVIGRFNGKSMLSRKKLKNQWN